MSKKIVRHIPTQSCYYTEEDGKTIIVAGIPIQPKIDGKVFWEYVEEYVEKTIVPTNPFVTTEANNENK